MKQKLILEVWFKLQKLIDLYKKEDQGEQSYSERQMYQAALERLAGEFKQVRLKMSTKLLLQQN